MECKYCGAALDDGVNVCPVCGKAQTDEMEVMETAEAAQVTEEAEATEAAETTEAAEAAEATEAAEEAANVKDCGRTEPCTGCDALSGCEHAEQYFAQELDAQKQAGNAAKREKKKKTVTTLVAVLLILALIASFVAMLVPKEPIAEPDEPAAPVQTPDTADATDANEPSEEHVSYTVTAEEMTDEVLDKVVATCGEDVLTNRMLNLYYWQQYYVFASAYGSYLPYIMDTSLGLDEQLYDENTTWQQQFLNSAAEMFHHVSAILQKAQEAGFTMPEEDQTSIDSLMASLPDAAASYGFENADAFLQAQFGPSVTEELYRQYVQNSTLAMAYLQSLVDAHEYTDADIEAFYDAHAEEYEQSRVRKLDTPNIDIRHILIVPEETDEEGNYTDAAWAVAQTRAEELLLAWRTGEATEESFAALAQENSADGSAAQGGLITDVYPGQMVDEFDAWCFDAQRQPGDVDIVKTQFGYHIMYFSAVGDEIHWRAVAESDYLNEISSTLEQQLADEYELVKTLDNAAIFDVLKATQESQQQEQAEQPAE